MFLSDKMEGETLSQTFKIQAATCWLLLSMSCTCMCCVNFNIIANNIIFIYLASAWTVSEQIVGEGAITTIG